MVHFDYVKISHFRSYIDTEIEFDSETGVYIINGDNGTGKSTFLNAINWCLYGDTPFYSVKRYIEVANIDDPDGTETSVELWATIDDYKYRFIRRVRKGQGTTGELSVQRAREIDANNYETLDRVESNDAVKQLVPKELRQLFFFNGEQLKDIYSGTGDGHNTLRSNVYQVSELDIIDNGINHLTELSKRYYKAITKNNKNKDKCDELKSDIEQLESAIKGSQELIDQYKDEVKDAKAKINTLDELIKNTADARSLIEQRDIYDKQIKELDTQIFNLKQDKNEILVENFHSAILFDKFADYAVVLNNAKSDGKIPAEVDPKVTRAILDSGICLCGHHITDEERALIQQRHDDYEKRQELQFLTDGIYKFSEIANKLPIEGDKYEDRVDRISELKTQKDNIAKKLKKINEQLEQVDTANIPDHPENERARLLSKIERNGILAVNAAQNKVKKEEELSEKKTELKRLTSADTDTKDYQNKYEYVEKLIETMSEVKDKMEKIIREKLEDKMWRVFSDILPNTEYKGIEISDTYSIRLKYKGDQAYSVEMLATGPAKVLGLALIYALSMDLGYKSVPLLIDNLYGDIADTHHEAMSTMINSLAKNKQIIVMNLVGTNTSDIHIGGNNVMGRFLIVKDENANEAKIVKEN
ncbi:AAA family ATPase [Candidatus Saccharibacteria bacterium]|nr:AAA family ATPase [Candidatus Saccharibacteria bacterium]